MRKRGIRVYIYIYIERERERDITGVAGDGVEVELWFVGSGLVRIRVVVKKFHVRPGRAR